LIFTFVTTESVHFYPTLTIGAGVLLKGLGWDILNLEFLLPPRDLG